MSYADLYQAIPATITVRGHRAHEATLALFWSNLRPCEINVTIRSGDTHQTWSVGRSLFIASHEEWCAGAWMGAGIFAVCYTGNKIMLGFRPPGVANAVVIAPQQAVWDYIQHTMALVPPGDPESEITIQRLDEELARILGETA